MPDQTLYLVRHGSVYNPDGIMYRRLPGFHLSDQGRREAGETARFLKEQPVETIYHSPLERARETAEILGKQIPAALVADERIHEWAAAELSQEVLDRMAAFLDWWRESGENVAAAVSHRDPIRRLLFHLAGRPWPQPDPATELPLPQAGVYRVVRGNPQWEVQLVFIPSEVAEAKWIEIDKI